MDYLQEQVKVLTAQLHALRTSSLHMQEEIARIDQQLAALQWQLDKAAGSVPAPVNIPAEQAFSKQPEQVPYQPAEPVITRQPAAAQEPVTPVVVRKPAPQPESRIFRSLEDFIGTNLISKVGILITIIGIFIGAKYAIDKELISPLMRIVLGYLCAGILSGIGLRLKQKYLQFSAVLVGGGIAVLYFITYTGYSFYGLFSQPAAFVLMLLTTIAAVLLALWYNQKIIALLGQVAAYAIPLLLSDGSGKVLVLFTYISMINAGLIVLSFKKDWKILYRLAFVITWVMYAYWLFFGNSKGLAYTGTLIFLTIHFITFYLTFLSYKIYKKELYNIGEIAVLLVNALAYFLLGYYVLDHQFSGVNALTLFTVLNAVIHFIAGYGIYKAKLADRSVEQFLAGLGLLFISIAIPVKLDGSWVTLLWALEAVILVTIAGRSGRLLYFEIAFPMMIVALLSLFQDWITADYDPPFFNNTFLVSLITCGCLFYNSYVAPAKIKALNGSAALERYYAGELQAAFIVVLYLCVYVQLFNALEEGALRIALLILYSLVFMAAGLQINTSIVKSKTLALCFRVACFITLAIMLTGGLRVLGDITEAWVRYACLAGMALTWVALIGSKAVFPPDKNTTILFSGAFNITLLSCICNEYLHWLDLAGYHNQYKLGLSLICGSYALVILFIGLVQDKKHLRVGAISLFAVTIGKLFVYDLASLSTISKTVVMIALGVLLLVASFLYNKYKAVLVGREDGKENEQNEQTH